MRALRAHLDRTCQGKIRPSGFRIHAWLIVHASSRDGSAQMQSTLRASLYLVHDLSSSSIVVKRLGAARRALRGVRSWLDRVRKLDLGDRPEQACVVQEPTAHARRSSCISSDGGCSSSRVANRSSGAGEVGTGWQRPPRQPKPHRLRRAPPSSALRHVAVELRQRCCA